MCIDGTEGSRDQSHGKHLGTEDDGSVGVDPEEAGR
jgi:hypothetical protein